MSARLKMRFARWLGGHAGAVCHWAYMVERRHSPLCPDCNVPEPECYCEARADEQAIYADIGREAYFEGRRDGYDDARREYA